MQPLDFADKNRAFATTILKATFGMAMAWIGAFVSLGFILVVVYNFTPEQPSSLIMAVWLLPMLVWALAAMRAGGTLAGLSLAPSLVWKPMLLSIVAGGLVLIIVLTFISTSQDPVLGFTALIVVSVGLTAMPTLVVTLFVATNNRQRMRLQFGLTLAGIVATAICWLAISIALPIAMRKNITELAGDQPYKLYVAGQKNKFQYRELKTLPGLWTFQSIFSADRTFRAHMCLYVGVEGGPRKGYHWSFFSGFRFLRNPKNAVWC